MGIPGLTAYINKHRFNFLEHYELRDTYLVIDGNNINYLLYRKCTHNNWTFGGDYDNYKQYVSDFFDDLLKCNVTPLVFLDGAVESKKFKTIIRRVKSKLNILPTSAFKTNYPEIIFPLLKQKVFIDVMKEKNVQIVQCLFEADDIIASVAKILNCPVLSHDSDFYTYGSLYIPFNTLNTYVVKNPNGNGYMKCCKIYKIEKLFKYFTGLDQSKMILASILLGNDYVEPGTFKNFFHYLKLDSSSVNYYTRQQYCINKILLWLSKYSLHDAIIEILSRLIMPMRQKMLDLIEISINGCRDECAEILITLGFSRDYITHVNTYYFNRSFKFDGDINTLTYIEEVCGRYNESIEENKEEDDEIEIAKIFTESELMFNTATISDLPIWFVNEFRTAKYPSYFLDLIIHRLYVCSIQVEDFRYPSNIKVSLKILSVIIEILKLMIDNNINYIRYLMRTEDKKIMCYKLEATEMNIFGLSSSFNLSDVSLFTKREILNYTLGITDMDCINELPPKWILYVGCIKYWIHQQECPISYKCYLYSIFICMLFDIVDFKIGKYRSIMAFNKKYKQTIEAIKQKRKESNYNPCCIINSTIHEAYNEIVHDDYVLAAPFFISLFKVDKTLYNTDKFDIHIVHVFGEFQSCLEHTMDLNTLLGYPYPQIKVAHLYNGTLLYNLCNNFRTHHNIEEYINTVLQMSPSLLRFFNTFLLKVKPMFSCMFQNK
ncbi:protein asteroid-like [Bombus vancouverensis nearcticus]|uniref:protein asteroid-like n=1 Tax=Bombus vancouverensis nearcticus TaxID=2705178 RepID=UPI00143A8C80|nr:protein asteroid-like [Bombus vancouverensis nearcticus]